MDYGLAFKLNEELYNNNIEFKKLIDIYTKTNQVRYFGDSEYQNIISQNFIPIVDDRNIFIGIVKRKEIIKYYLESLVKEKEKNV